MKIVADKQIDFVQQACAGIAELCLCDGMLISAADLYDADVLLVRSVTRVNRSLLDGSAVRFVASVTSGVEHVDVEYLQQHGIGFAHARGSNARAVAEYVLSCLYVMTGSCLKDKSVGVVGCGRVGSLLASMLEVIGTRVIRYDPPLENMSGGGVVRYDNMDALLSADVISLHVPLTANVAYATKCLVNADFLRCLKLNAILVNTARGNIIDRYALQAYLATHAEVQFAFDVWHGEPNIDGSLLDRCTVATPHIAGYSMLAKSMAITNVLQAVCGFFGLVMPALSWAQFKQQKSLVLDATVSEDEALKMAVLTSYDVRNDDALLRQVGAVPVARFFSDLRRDYVPRSEFSSLSVVCPKNRLSLRQRLLGLGFSVSGGE